MSKAYASTLDISFEVRGGLFVRQVHHWAALLFAAAIMVHLARIFFTGAFRRPREANWVIGSLLLILAMFEGYFGYSLPDDLLSGSACAPRCPRSRWACRSSAPGCIGRCSAVTSPVAAWDTSATRSACSCRGCTHAHPADPRIILALIGVHLALVWFQKHTQFPGPGRTETNVVGVRVMPVFAIKSGAFFAMVVGILGLMGGLLQINPIWQLGPQSRRRCRRAASRTST